jgi:hypothetical protein
MTEIIGIIKRNKIKEIKEKQEHLNAFEAAPYVRAMLGLKINENKEKK